MEILLFNQYFTSPKEFPDTVLATVPLNLLYLASFLKEKGIESKIYDLGLFDSNKIVTENNRIRCGVSNKEITEIINKESPKIIALGCMYSRHYIDIIAIARLIKKINPFIKIILGGNHATAFCALVLKKPYSDFVFRDSEFDEGKYEEMNRILDDRGTPTKYFTADEIKQIQVKAYRSFIIYRAFTFLNPLRLLRKIRSQEDFKYTMRLIFIGAGILIKSFYKKSTKMLLYD